MADPNSGARKRSHECTASEDTIHDASSRPTKQQKLDNDLDNASIAGNVDAVMRQVIETVGLGDKMNDDSIFSTKDLKAEHPAMRPLENRGCMFLEIATELRSMIYEFTFGLQVCVEIDEKANIALVKAQKDDMVPEYHTVIAPPALALCHQVYEEASSIFWTKTTFVVEPTIRKPERDLRGIFVNIRKIELRIDLSRFEYDCKTPDVLNLYSWTWELMDSISRNASLDRFTLRIERRLKEGRNNTSFGSISLRWLPIIFELDSLLYGLQDLKMRSEIILVNTVTNFDFKNQAINDVVQNLGGKLHENEVTRLKFVAAEERYTALESKLSAAFKELKAAEHGLRSLCLKSQT